MCKAVNLRSSAYDIYIGRAGHGQHGTFGNPFIAGVHFTKRGDGVTLFAEWFKSDKGALMRELVKQQIKPGDRLGCFCSPASCHGDIIAAYVNNNYTL